MNNNLIQQLSSAVLLNQLVFTPVFYRIHQQVDHDKLAQLLQEQPNIMIYDQLFNQLEELIKSKNPQRKFTKPELAEAIKLYLGSQPIEEYGVWVYYPWSQRLVHILDEEEFVFLRTSRNQYKITPEERSIMATKKVGVVGLSVGQSVSLTMAMERSFGELRLADFDLLELTNLNRIRTGVHNLGIPKAISVAREIMEIDPYLNLVCYTDGLQENNMDDFFTKGGKLDLLIEECDGLDIKVLCRHKAKALQIPVLMEASDRGMVDVERFDLEPNRPILHGLIDHLDVNKLKTLKTNEEKMPYLLPMIGIDTISNRLKASMLEIEQSITTWPQLASAVTLGGGITADVARRILLNSFSDSGRYYVDVEELIGNKEREIKDTTSIITHQKKEFDLNRFISKTNTPTENYIKLSKSDIEDIVGAAILAPSGGNCQPWIWHYSDKGILTLVHDSERSASLLDFDNTASYISLGAAIENLILKSHEKGFEVTVNYFPVKEEQHIIASILFHENNFNDLTIEQHDPYSLAEGISMRLTNRMNIPRKKIDESKLSMLANVAKQIPGAELRIIDKEEDINELGDIIAQVERLRFMHKRGHQDFVNEIRWTEEENQRTRDGIDIKTVDLTVSELVGFNIARDWNIIKHLKDWDRGKVFEKLSRKNIQSASVLGYITMPNYSPLNFVQGGRAVQKVWLAANKNGVAFQPQSPSLFFFHRLIHGKGIEMDEKMKNEIQSLRVRFEKLMPLNNRSGEIFIFRLFQGDTQVVKSLRRPINEVLIYN